MRSNWTILHIHNEWVLSSLLCSFMSWISLEPWQRSALFWEDVGTLGAFGQWLIAPLSAELMTLRLCEDSFG